MERLGGRTKIMHSILRNSCFAAALAMLPAAAQIPTGVTFETFYDVAKISFTQPTFVGPVPGDPDQLIVIERAGKVSRLVKSASGYEKKAWFSVDPDTATHWDGVWTVEFHPKFLQNHLFYVLYRQKINATRSVIEEWKADADLANPVKLRSVMEFDQKGIHSSGDMKFGPDGYLYSSQGDRQQSGQDLNETWGKMLRIDVDKKDPGLEYAIPADNPFRTQAGTRAEIYALGFRMPWRMSFDKLNGDLFLGDVGETTHEEINLVTKGSNYGAGIVEGNCATNCAKLTDPLVAEARTAAQCVIGGFVYRADPTSKFYGIYLFGDYAIKKIYAGRLNAAKTAFSEVVSVADAMPGNVSALGQDGRGNFYAAMYTETGASLATQIYRLKHAELRPEASVGILSRTSPGIQGNGNVTSDAGGYRVFSLDGKALGRIEFPSGPESGSRASGETGNKSGANVRIFRDENTGRIRKFILPSP